MKKAFTLIEMLIVVVVLTTLMTIVFRLSTIGNDSWRRSETIARINKLENCMSGYYAAFGSYPPVKLHASRDINMSTDANGMQDQERNVNWGNEGDAWRSVKAACLAQPMACNFPFAEGYSDAIRTLSDTLAEIVNEKTEGYEFVWSSDGGETADEAKAVKFGNGFDDGGSSGGTGRFAPYKGNSSWRKLQLFRFGVMSYLLPRYLVMMGAHPDFYDGGFAQWSDNNTKPCNPYTGEEYQTWSQMQHLTETGNKSDIAQLANIPSQAVCARWIPNLAGICAANHNITLFGVTISDTSHTFLTVHAANAIPIYTPNCQHDNKDQYVLDAVTVLDAWERDIYYYSPAPYQRYEIWSAGADGKTFPPWVSRSKLPSEGNRVVSRWIKDDINSLSN